MKWILFAFFSLTSVIGFAEKDTLPSAVYEWEKLNVELKDGNQRRNILEGRSTHLEYLEIHTTTVPPGKASHPPHSHLDTEELIIVKEGASNVTIGDSSRILGRWSVAVAMPGDQHGFITATTTPATYYVIKYRSKGSPGVSRDGKARGSILIDWRDVLFKELPKGGSRQFFERPTGMLTRLEMHATTLKEGLKSHDPHTHTAEEIILVLSGEVDMLIDGIQYRAQAGDLLFVRSGSVHAPRNAGKGECTYFAIQWQ